MSARTTAAAGWPDDEPLSLPLPKGTPGDDESNFAPEDDADLGLETALDEVGLDDVEGLEEPLEAELSNKSSAEDAGWTHDSETASDLEGAEDELQVASSEYGWTDGNEPSEVDDLEDETLGAELRETTEDAGDEGLGDEEELGEAMELPPLRSGGAAEPDDDGVDVQVIEGEALPDERRVEVLEGMSWSALPEGQVRLERGAPRALQPQVRRLRMGDFSWLSITADGLLCAGTEAEPAQRQLPEVGPALCLAGDGGRRVAVLAREPSGRPRLSLSLDAGRTFSRLKLPGTAFPRQLLALGSTLLVVLPEEGAFQFHGDGFRPVLAGELHGACLVLEDDEVQLYAHLRVPRGSWLVRRSLGSHSRSPQVVLELGSVSPVELSGAHDAGQTRLELVGESGAWTVWISSDGSGAP
jgi:hypothetical protein